MKGARDSHPPVPEREKPLRALRIEGSLEAPVAGCGAGQKREGGLLPGATRAVRRAYVPATQPRGAHPYPGWPLRREATAGWCALATTAVGSAPGALGWPL